MTDSQKAGWLTLVPRVMFGLSRVTLLVMMVQAANAGEMFRWIDGEGRMHFGDRPPPAGVAQVEALNLPAYAEPSLPADQDPYSIINQLGRLETDRQNRERGRREKAWADREYYLRQRELDLREQEAAASPQEGAVRGYLSPIYPWQPGHHPGRPGHRPGRPELRPPHRPPGPWEPDHPAYRPRPPYVAPRPPIARPGPGPAGRGATFNLRR